MLSGQLTAKEIQYNTLVQSTGLDENGALAVVESKKVLETTVLNLRSQIAEMQMNYDRVERERTEANTGLRTLQDQNQKLTTQIKAMASNYVGGSTMFKPLSYSAKAYIISVLGSGSYVTTTTAFSTALNLADTARVIFIDFDMISPKADVFFKTSPMVEGVPGLQVRSPKNTGLGIALNMGATFALNNIRQIIKPVIRTKNGCLDYYSGIYDKFDIVKIVSCDYEALLNYFGNSYDYIIIDFGRIGASELNNQIMKAFSDISKSTVVVTSADKVDIRNARMLIDRIGINLDFGAWLVNLAESTKIDENSKKRIYPAAFSQMIFIDDFYGKKKDFSKDHVSRDRFKNFINQCILRR